MNFFVLLILSINLILVLGAIVYYLYTINAIYNFFQQEKEVNNNFSPPISILKPLCGLEANIYDNLASFLNQNYSQYQIIFCVQNEKDPVILILQELIKNFPEHDLKLVVNNQLIGHNYQVSNLANGLPFCHYDYIVIADSDIQVKSDYLSTIIQPMIEEKVGVVTCLYQSEYQQNNLLSIIENLNLTCSFVPSVLTANKLEGLSFAFGSTILIRKKVLLELGGFSAIGNSLGDDFLLGNLPHKLGYQVILANYFVKHDIEAENYQDYFARKIRWNRSIRLSRFWSYLGIIFTQGFVSSISLILISLLANKWVNFALILAGITIILRLIMAYIVSIYYLQNETATKKLGYLFLTDILDFILWLLGLWGNEVKWRGKRFIVDRQNQLQLKP